MIYRGNVAYAPAVPMLRLSGIIPAWIAVSLNFARAKALEGHVQLITPRQEDGVRTEKWGLAIQAEVGRVAACAS